MSNLAYSQIEVPKKYEAEIKDYLGYLLSKEEKEKNKDRDVSSLFGCLEKRGNPLQEQREMRDEWND